MFSRSNNLLPQPYQPLLTLPEHRISLWLRDGPYLARIFRMFSSRTEIPLTALRVRTNHSKTIQLHLLQRIIGTRRILKADLMPITRREQLHRSCGTFVRCLVRNSSWDDEDVASVCLDLDPAPFHFVIVDVRYAEADRGLSSQNCHHFVRGGVVVRCLCGTVAPDPLRLPAIAGEEVFRRHGRGARSGSLYSVGEVARVVQQWIR